jgi:hypothetical protein
MQTLERIADIAGIAWLAWALYQLAVTIAANIMNARSGRHGP